MISKIELINSNIDFITYKKNTPYKLTLKDINYSISNLGTYQEALATGDLKFKINQNTNVSLTNFLKLEPLSISGKLDINNLKIKELYDYEKELFNFSINDNSNANLILDYNISTTKRFDLKLDSKKLEINNLSLKQNNEILTSLKKLDIKSFNLDLKKQK